MKSSFLKLGKQVSWHNIGKEILANLERFTPEDYEYLRSQTLSKETLVPSSDTVEILPAQLPNGRDLYQRETTIIYKCNGKYIVHDSDSTKDKYGIGFGNVRIIDAPTKMKGYNTHKKSCAPKTKFVCPEKMF